MPSSHIVQITVTFNFLSSIIILHHHRLLIINTNKTLTVWLSRTHFPKILFNSSFFYICPSITHEGQRKSKSKTGLEVPVFESSFVRLRVTTFFTRKDDSRVIV